MIPTIQLAMSKDFLSAMGRLPKVQQKKVREFITRFQTNPTLKSLNYETIQAKDDRVRTARVDQTYRAVILHPKVGNIYVLVWVDHHDDAMDWAKRRTFDINPVTGALQIIDTEMLTEVEELIPAETLHQVDAPHLFSGISDDDLKLTGLPEILLPSIRAIEQEAQLESLAGYLPEESFEALMWLAEGYSVQEALNEVGLAKQPQVVDIDDVQTALENPSSQRRFVTIESLDELDEILKAPLEQWRIFLHPTQRKYVGRDYNGPARVLGGAGTGKTVVAMHRARFLSKERFAGAHDRILFTTFTRNLANNIRQNMGNLCSTEELSRIEVTNLHAWAARFLRQQGMKPAVVGQDELDECWRRALTLADDTYDEDFIRSEWEHVIEANGIGSLNQYRRVARVGQRVRLSRKQRDAIWLVFEEVRRQLDELGKITFGDLITQARLVLENKQLAPPYKAIIVDESQDLQPEEFRLLRALVAPGKNDLFFVGDSQQRIYKRSVVMSRCGIEIRGRARRLKINYRTTEQIRNWSVSLLNGVPNDDLNGSTDQEKGYRSLRQGASPTVRHFSTQRGEIDFLVEQMMDLVTGRATYEDICLVARKSQLLEDYKEALQQAGIECYVLHRDTAEDEGVGIRMATMHRVKGLEFPHVFVAAVNDGIIPVAGYIDGSDLDEDGELLERCLLHVATTRARDSLTISSHKIPSRFLAEIDQSDTI